MKTLFTALLLAIATLLSAQTYTWNAEDVGDGCTFSQPPMTVGFVPTNVCTGFNAYGSTGFRNVGAYMVTSPQLWLGPAYDPASIPEITQLTFHYRVQLGVFTGAPPAWTLYAELWNVTTATKVADLITPISGTGSTGATCLSVTNGGGTNIIPSWDYYQVKIYLTTAATSTNGLNFIRLDDIDFTPNWSGAPLGYPTPGDKQPGSGLSIPSYSVGKRNEATVSGVTTADVYLHKDAQVAVTCSTAVSSNPNAPVINCQKTSWQGKHRVATVNKATSAYSYGSWGTFTVTASTSTSEQVYTGATMSDATNWYIHEFAYETGDPTQTEFYTHYVYLKVLPTGFTPVTLVAATPYNDQLSDAAANASDVLAIATASFSTAKLYSGDATLAVGTNVYTDAQMTQKLSSTTNWYGVKEGGNSFAIKVNSYGQITNISTATAPYSANISSTTAASPNAAMSLSTGNTMYMTASPVVVNTYVFTNNTMQTPVASSGTGYYKINVGGTQTTIKVDGAGKVTDVQTVAASTYTYAISSTTAATAVAAMALSTPGSAYTNDNSNITGVSHLWTDTYRANVLPSSGTQYYKVGTNSAIMVGANGFVSTIVIPAQLQYSGSVSTSTASTTAGVTGFSTPNTFYTASSTLAVNSYIYTDLYGNSPVASSGSNYYKVVKGGAPYAVKVDGTGKITAIVSLYAVYSGVISADIAYDIYDARSLEVLDTFYTDDSVIGTGTIVYSSQDKSSFVANSGGGWYRIFYGGMYYVMIVGANGYVSSIQQ